jgi:hypothetical protein
MRKLVVYAVLLTAIGALAAGASRAQASVGTESNVLGGADPQLADPLAQELAIDQLNQSSSGTQQYGPFTSTSPDSGTCGNDWAQDTFDRVFKVTPRPDGTFRVTEQFKNGSFVTNAGPSPGACDLSDGTGPGIVTSGLVGTMHGYLDMTVTCTTTIGCPATGASCTPTTCGTTGGFLATVFPTGIVTTDAYFFHYAGYDGTNQALVVHEWKNASCNRGGNHGDIATAAVATGPQFATC